MEKTKTKTKTKTILSFSGGLDSTVLLAHLLEQNLKVTPVAFIYPSKHNEYEMKAALSITNYYNLDLHIINLTPAMLNFKSNLLLSGKDIPEGYYNHPNMKLTIIPGRNLIFTSILTGLAQSFNIKSIHLAIHSGDHYIYPDCRPDFYFYLKQAIYEGTDHEVSLIADFLKLNKTNITCLGDKLKAPLHLTRTCYKNQLLPCGKCGSCIERLEAFQENGLIDPLTYKK